MNRDSSYLTGNQFAKGNLPNKTSFPKGHIPWNKGLKGIHMSPATEFKKGHTTNKTYSIGTVKKRTRTREGYGQEKTKRTP